MRSRPARPWLWRPNRGAFRRHRRCPRRRRGRRDGFLPLEVICALGLVMGGRLSSDAAAAVELQHDAGQEGRVVARQIKRRLPMSAGSRMAEGTVALKEARFSGVPRPWTWRGVASRRRPARARRRGACRGGALPPWTSSSHAPRPWEDIVDGPARTRPESPPHSSRHRSRHSRPSPSCGGRRPQRRAGSNFPR